MSEPAIFDALTRGDLVSVLALAEDGADLEVRSSWGQNPFEWAALLGRSRAAEALLKRGSPGLSFWTAAALGRLPDVRRFWRQAASLEELARPRLPRLDPRGWPPDTAYARGDAVSDAFHAAARNGHLATATWLLERGADVDATGYFGATALHWAAHNGHARMAGWLAERGADLRRRDPCFDATPAGWADEGGYAELAGRLRSLEG